MISVVIPTYYRYERLEKILSFLREQSLKPDEIIIIDQTPHRERPKNFYKKVKGLPVVLVDLNTPSLSRSRNIGAEKASGRYLLFLDDDMEFGSELIRNHLHVMEKEAVDVVSGAISTGPTLLDTYKRDMKRLDPLSFFLKSPNKKWDGMTLVVSGANTMIKRDLFLRVGGFDENMPRMEDIELGYRLYKVGAKVFYSSNPHAVHNAAPTGGTRASQKNIQYIKLLSRVYLYHKHFDGWARQQFYLLVMKNGFSYRDQISGAFYLSHLRQPFWPLQTCLMLYKAHRQSILLLKKK
ncbi:MAG: glycosyltransferase family 2 protein [Candidatus Electrothrix sp. AR1]|nr:glycosyltransferase family 2 protein [Candidatus Electrothrix sp. AR1]